MKKIDGKRMMSTKEVAVNLGVTSQAIRDRAKALFPDKNIKPREALYFSEEEVTVILETMKNNPSNNLQSSTLQNMTTSLTPAYKAQQFISSIDYTDESAVDMVTATITALSSNLIAALHGENKTLRKENKMLKHQVEYNEVIGCSRWTDVKKLLGIKEKWDVICDNLNLEENVDFFKKCMGYDTYPTIMIPDSTIAKIKECFC